MEFFDPARVVAFPTLSLASGAIKGWDRRNGYYFALLESLARHYKFSVDVPFEELAEPVRHAVLHGSGDEDIRFSYTMDSGQSAGRKVSKKHPFEGILPNMERRYRETDSVAVREELARYRSMQPCPECAGTRLRSEARHVKLGDDGAGPGDLRDRPHDAARELRVFPGPAAARRQGRDRRQGGARDRPAAEIPQRRGPELPQPGPQRRDAVRAARRSASASPRRSARASRA